MSDAELLHITRLAKDSGYYILGAASPEIFNETLEEENVREMADKVFGFESAEAAPFSAFNLEATQVRPAIGAMTNLLVNRYFRGKVGYVDMDKVVSAEENTDTALTRLQGLEGALGHSSVSFVLAGATMELSEEEVGRTGRLIQTLEKLHDRGLPVGMIATAAYLQEQHVQPLEIAPIPGTAAEVNQPRAAVLV